ncbi:MAG: transglutaminase-like cysteine peptidase [Alphaproteobacteria bacterium]|nr:transglutaminase-like cysteine peptidase [Alphaproteobacteria bacterium]
MGVPCFIAKNLARRLPLRVEARRAARFFVPAMLLTLATMLLPSTPAWALLNPLLMGQQVRSLDISPFTKWTSLMPRYEQQRAQFRDDCVGKGCLNRQWEALLRRLHGKPLHVKIEEVNRFFNAIRYMSDADNYGTEDVWQTPYEMMARGGDCEDYAIAKYISLKRLGVPENSMRILVVRDTNLDGTIHAMLEVKVGGAAQILDNQAKKVLPITHVFHYEPIFAINENEWWAYE